MKRFPLFLGVGLAAFFATLAIIAWVSAPTGTRWLGDGIHNSSDIAVYFSYLRQGADGHILLKDLYAVEPNRPRYDPVWSTLGLFARAGIDPIVIHEAARALFILLLVMSLWFATRSKLATILAIGGVGTGWIYSVWLGMNGLWTPQTYAAPDIVTEFAIGPTLFGGAHMILSIALLVTAIRLLWTGLERGERRTTLLGAFAGTALLSFHPYFAPLLGLLGLTAFAKRRKNVFGLVLAGLIMLPPVIYYLWLLSDPVFGAHHLVDNILPLNAPAIWLITLAPFLVAFTWMWRVKKLPKKLEWTSAWVLAVILLLLFLPVPWKRKLTEGLIIPLVFLTMPTWFAVRDWVGRQRPRAMQIVLAGLLLLGAWLGPVHLVLSQIAWFSRTDAQHFFYQPQSVFDAATRLRNEMDDVILLSDERWVNVWLPALSGKRVWIGHDHETPDFKTKRETYAELLATDDPVRARTILNEAHVSNFLTTSAVSTNRFTSLLAPEWTIEFQADTVAVWKRIPSL